MYGSNKPTLSLELRYGLGKVLSTQSLPTMWASRH